MPHFVIALFLVVAAIAGRADVSSRKPPGVAPADAFALRRFEMLPAFPAPPFLAAQFPREVPMAAVEAMAFSDGRLWLSVRARDATNLPAGAGRLWAFTPDANRLEPIRGALEQHTVNALHPDGSKLWLALDGGGANFDTQTFTVEAFGSARGVNATGLIGFADVPDGLLTMGNSGGLYRLAPTAKDFTRLSNPAPVRSPGDPEAWRFFAGSREWLLAATESFVANRNIRAAQWLPLNDELGRYSPRLAPPRLHCVTGDGEGGFWLGSDAGLHWLNPDTGAVENRFAPVSVTVTGGLGVQIAPGMQPTAAAYRQARERVMTGVRDRMRQRARAARARVDARLSLSPMLPSSRLPGGVTALLQDRSFLWLATTDGLNPGRARVLLFHPSSRKWIGWFAVGSPVRSFAANDHFLWLGLDVTQAPGATPLVAIDKQPLLAAPPLRWTSDAIKPVELGTRLASLSLKERAVYAFFSGDGAKVVELFAPADQPRDGLDAESLFLLAFAHDAAGLDQPDQLDRQLGQLRAQFPDSLFTEIANGVRPVGKPVGAEAAAMESAAETVAEVLARRDLNGDSKLNLIEFRLWRGPAADFQAADQNGDGQLDAAELAAVLKRAAR